MLIDNIKPLMKLTFTETTPKRLDKFLTDLESVEGETLEKKSRNYWQNLIEKGTVTVNGKTVKCGFMLNTDDKIEWSLPKDKPLDLKTFDLKLDIIFEDDDVLVLNKPAGLVVHPGVNGVHADDSLVNAVLAHCGDKLKAMNSVIRPGIVHRLDKDTTGIIVVTKNEKAYEFVSSQFKDRTVKKEYLALVAGKITPIKGRIEAPIGRDSQDRKKMAVTSIQHGKMAITEYVLDSYYKEGVSLLKVHILTGRTHQIRVHLSEIGFPIVGDVTYGRKKANAYFEDDFSLKRQFLHAAKLSFVLPSTKKSVCFEAKLPADLEGVLKGLHKE